MQRESLVRNAAVTRRAYRTHADQRVVAGGERPDVWRDEDQWPPEHVLLRKRAAADRLGLHKRHYDVLVLVADGLTNREIGKRLLIGEQTVQSHMKAILAALDARNRAHAIGEAFRRDLLV